MDRYEELTRFTVAEAAHRLGVKEQAIRKRIQRGTLPHDKDETGRVYVYIDAEAEDEVQGEDTRANTHLEVLVDTLQEQNRFLREELARKDAILLNMTEAMKAISPPVQEEPSEPPGGRVRATEEPERAEPRSASGGPQTGTEHPQERRGFWSRLFGGG
jgi:hypothetical protein